MSNAQYRCLAPATARSPITTNTRTYNCAPGTTVDVTLSDANVLTANGWLMLGQVGPTSSRPTASADVNRRVAGTLFVDTDLGEFVVFDGLAWRDTAGALA